MIAQLPIVADHSEVVVVAGAEHAVRDYLVLTLSAVDNPHGSRAGLELELVNLALLCQSQGLLEPLLESSFQDILQLVIHYMCPAELLTRFLKDTGFADVLGRAGSHHSPLKGN